MQVASGQRPFEVYCLRCGVSFPAGTRTCIHCGNRTVRERPVKQAVRISPVPGGAVPGDEMDEEFDVEDEIRRRSRFSPVALMWVVLLIIGTIYRACAGG